MTRKHSLTFDGLFREALKNKTCSFAYFKGKGGEKIPTDFHFKNCTDFQ